MVAHRNIQQRLYCCGYWHVPGNTKNSVEQYERYLPRTLDMIAGGNLRFLSDDADLIEKIEGWCRDRAISVDTVVMDQAALPGAELALRLLAGCENMALDSIAKPPSYSGEKGMNHYWRDLVGSGKEAFHAMLAIWMSKVPLAAALAETSDPDQSVAWIDASIARFVGQRENDDFARVSTPVGKVSHYASPMRFLGARLPLNASFLSADVPTWAVLHEEFGRAADRAAAMPYGHDEETILADCVWRRPELFHCIGKPVKQRKAPVWHRFTRFAGGRSRQ
ncbi:hypothetical protein [Tropicimonas marinistellae]|uniref:hypothetical protein n=1 Tax=Tropicimonas marinistellae TaxID=1739787 RepID=UPI0008330E26|nr:hypothetical protein [Tropicimonas marinistellae]